MVSRGKRKMENLGKYAILNHRTSNEGSIPFTRSNLNWVQ
jgi:hypothetical protein